VNLSKRPSQKVEALRRLLQGETLVSPKDAFAGVGGRGCRRGGELYEAMRACAGSQSCAGNQSSAARALGLKLSTFRDKLAKHNLQELTF